MPDKNGIDDQSCGCKHGGTKNKKQEKTRKPQQRPMFNDVAQRGEKEFLGSGDEPYDGFLYPCEGPFRSNHGITEHTDEQEG